MRNSIRGPSVGLYLTKQGAAVVPAGGYTYLRILVTANNGDGLLQVTEMEVASTAGGANLCVGGTASASSTYLTYTASLAFDGIKNNNNFSWLGGTTFPVWLKYQFGSPVTPAELRLWGPVTGTESRGPKDFKLQGSNDDATWADLKTVTGDIYVGSYEQKTHAVP